MAEGLQQGHAEASREIAARLKAAGLEAKAIASATGLNEEEIEKLLLRESLLSRRTSRLTRPPRVSGNHTSVQCMTAPERSIPRNQVIWRFANWCMAMARRMRICS